MLFALLLAIGVAYLAWATRALIRGDHHWAAFAAYALVLFALSFFSIRFGGSASIPLATFAGLASVHIAEQVDLARRPAHFREGAISAKTDGSRRPPDGEDDGTVDFSWPDGSAFASLVVLGSFSVAPGLCKCTSRLASRRSPTKPTRRP